MAGGGDHKIFEPKLPGNNPVPGLVDCLADQQLLGGQQLYDVKENLDRHAEVLHPFEDFGKLTGLFNLTNAQRARANFSHF